jgi:hypothetical protein
MPLMTYRTTFALDEATAERIKRLSRTWQVSQAEVVRRAVALADEQLPGKADAEALLKELHQSGKGLAREAAETYLAEARANRKHWRRSP